MVAYFDSSVLLAILLSDSFYDEASSLWEGTDFSLGSFLLKIECRVSLRRAHKISKHRKDEAWLIKKMDELDRMLSDIHYKPIDNDIESIIARNAGLAACRTLDAIHIATALYFKTNSREQNIILCTFDNNMTDLAKHLGFKVNVK